MDMLRQELIRLFMQASGHTEEEWSFYDDGEGHVQVYILGDPEMSFPTDFDIEPLRKLLIEGLPPQVA